ncbi:M15 family metallopeptidase [Cellulomonas edaphi]|uniref:M15 family metallopeptidase n=1 Tax=Cellulomonas edaphi TaxID=3053468 RepID=A0ABT7S458_9CELL|nr:M15 family metallopeptidase [Cellulomons edaphi]MDM7830412.1 M15 family metallopeptidase [Cellulomons edaphi]
MSNVTRSAERLAVRLTKGALVAVLAGGLTATAAVARTATVAESNPGESASTLVASGRAAEAGATGGGTGGVSSSATHSARTVAAARTAVVDVAADAVEVARAAQSTGKATDVDTAQLTKLKAATVKLEALVEKARTTPVTAAPRKQAAASRSASRLAPEPGSSSEPADRSTSAASDAAAATPDAAASAPVAPDVAPRAPEVDGPLTSAAESAQVFSLDLSPSAAAAAGSGRPDSVDDLVVPAVTGPEDATTEQLRDAVEDVVAITASVEHSAEVHKKADEAAERRAAAQRAAWKRSLQGYPNGQVPASALCRPSFDAHALLRCDAAQGLEKLNTAYRAQFGRNVELTDSYRSYAGQVSCRARKGSLCAVPGTSNHGSGVAVDFAGGIQTFGSRQHQWMVDHAAAFGWHHPAWAQAGGGKPEAWHWEYAG